MSHTTNAFVLGSMAASVGSRSSTMDGGGVRSIPPLPCTCLSVMNRCPCCARDDRKDEHNPPKRPQFAFIRMRIRIRSAAAEVAAIDNNIQDAGKKKPPLRPKSCRKLSSHRVRKHGLPGPNFQNLSLSPPRRGCVSRSNPVKCSATVRPVKTTKNGE